MARLRAGHARPLQSGYYKVEGMKNPTAGVVVGKGNSLVYAIGLVIADSVTLAAIEMVEELAAKAVLSVYLPTVY